MKPTRVIRKYNIYTHLSLSRSLSLPSSLPSLSIYIFIYALSLIIFTSNASPSRIGTSPPRVKVGLSRYLSIYLFIYLSIYIFVRVGVLLLIIFTSNDSPSRIEISPHPSPNRPPSTPPAVFFTRLRNPEPPERRLSKRMHRGAKSGTWMRWARTA